MDPIEFRREITRRMIAINSVEIGLTRVTKVSDGDGGWMPGPTVDLPAQTMRLHFSSLGGTKNLAKEAGQFQVTRPGLLAEHDADIQKDDTFERDGRKYRVDRVNIIRLLGHPVSLQCELEEVS